MISVVEVNIAGLQSVLSSIPISTLCFVLFRFVFSFSFSFLSDGVRSDNVDVEN